MFISDIPKLTGSLPSEAKEVFALVEDELRGTSVIGSRRRQDMLKVRDQLAGAPAATDEKYHPPQEGLSAELQDYFRRTLERSHVNLVEPALDRLVNSIHSGNMKREVSKALPDAQRLVKAAAHASAMARLCENAFAYGTGFLVPVTTLGGAVRYWLPSPLRTFLATDPADVTDILGILEIVPGRIGGESAVRWVTKASRGVVREGGAVEKEEHKLNFLPAVVAYGRDRTHHGEKYGRSLMLGVAEAAIRVTNNEVNLELHRDRQTQSLLVVVGEPNRTSADDESSKGKYIGFPNGGGDAKYVTPDSRIPDVIDLTKRFCEDAAISSGLPLDTFLPSLIAGSDASATAARIRAFPLQQRMVRMVMDWERIESQAALIVAGVAMSAAGTYASESLEELELLVQPKVTIKPSLPEADAETLSNWQQKAANFMAPIEDAIEYYNPGISEEDKEELVKSWIYKNDPRKQSEPDAPSTDDENIDDVELEQSEPTTGNSGTDEMSDPQINKEGASG